MRQQLPPLGVKLGRYPSFVLCAFVLAALFAPAAVHLAGRATDTSIIDNRRPAAFPAWPRSVDEFGAFRVGLDKYVDDNFGLRAELLRLNWKVHSWLGLSSNPNLIIGKTGWVYLNSEDAIEQYRGTNRFTAQSLDDWIDAMERYQRWFHAHGSTFVVTIAPDAQTIYPEYLPGYVNIVNPQTRQDQIVARLRERRSPLLFVDVRSALLAAKRRGALYNKYESHWNALGSFFAYEEIMRALAPKVPGLKPLQLSDLASSYTRRDWILPWEGELVPVFTLKEPSTASAPRAVPDPEHTIYKISTSRPGAPSLVFLHDSFGIGLLDYLKETFNPTTLVYSNQAMEAVARREHHDVVILEMVERYLPISRPDNQKFTTD